jgi:hypothetical protein
MAAAPARQRYLSTRSRSKPASSHGHCRVLPASYADHRGGRCVDQVWRCKGTKCRSRWRAGGWTSRCRAHGHPAPWLHCIREAGELIRYFTKALKLNADNPYDSQRAAPAPPGVPKKDISRRPSEAGPHGTPPSGSPYGDLKPSRPPPPPAIGGSPVTSGDPRTPQPPSRSTSQRQAPKAPVAVRPPPEIPAAPTYPIAGTSAALTSATSAAPAQVSKPLVQSASTTATAASKTQLQKQASTKEKAGTGAAQPRRRDNKKNAINDADVIAKLQAICTDADPTQLYRSLVKIGQG